MSFAFDPEQHTFRYRKMEDIVQKAVSFFKQTPPSDFPPPVRFDGAGVYALYYKGSFSLYQRLTELNADALVMPIYVGKAVPPGWRTGVMTGEEGSVYSRLIEHRNSIRHARITLDVSDFRCRFVILRDPESGLIPAVEHRLITTFNPIWNSVMPGFGIHGPGTPRSNQLISEWDSVHSGRPFTLRMTGGSSDPVAVAKKVAEYLNRLEFP